MIEDKFTDPRDGKTYRTVRLIDKIWMAENLNFDVGEGCWFYDNDPSYETTYGRRDPNGDYDGLEKAGSYWSGTEQDTQIAGNYGLNIYRMVGVDGQRDKSFGLSGRCIREIDHFSYWDLP